MKCKKAKDCVYYDVDSYTCNYMTDKNYCGHFRKNLVLMMFVFIIIFNVVSVLAVPPITSINTNTGIQIEHPITDPIKTNTTHQFHFHLYNISDGKSFLNSSDIQCDFHLYNSSGYHLIEARTIPKPDLYDWEYIVNAGNISKEGQYSFVILCNDTAIGGFYEHDFLVTNTGEALPSNGLLIFFILLIMILIGSTCYLAIYSLGHLVSMDFDVIDLAINLGLFFMILTYFYFENKYLADNMINSYMMLLILISGLVLVLLSGIAFILSLANNTFNNKGTIRVPKRFGR